jgi:hypothetical protein
MPAMYLKVEFMYIRDYFQVFPDDNVKLSFYLESAGNPRSVAIAYDAPPATPVCEPTRIADTIGC